MSGRCGGETALSRSPCRWSAFVAHSLGRRHARDRLDTRRGAGPHPEGALLGGRADTEVGATRLRPRMDHARGVPADSQRAGADVQGLDLRRVTVPLDAEEDGRPRGDAMTMAA